MSLLHWVDSPFEVLERGVNSALDELSDRLLPQSEPFTPSLDISEDDENFYIIAELPGLNDSDVKVTTDDEVLTITGAKKQEDETIARTYYHTERAFGQFVRSLSLPRNVRANAITAMFRDGLLELTLPKIVRNRPERREVALNTTRRETRSQTKGSKVGSLTGTLAESSIRTDARTVGA